MNMEDYKYPFDKTIILFLEIYKVYNYRVARTKTEEKFAAFNPILDFLCHDSHGSFFVWLTQIEVCFILLK